MGAYSNQKSAHGQLCVVVHQKLPYCDRLADDVASSNHSKGIAEGLESGLRSKDKKGPVPVEDDKDKNFLRNDFNNKKYKRRGSMKSLLVKLSPVRV